MFKNEHVRVGNETSTSLGWMKSSMTEKIESI